MSDETTEWLRSGKYLPEPLRDFHNAKDVFKAIDEIYPEDPKGLIKRPDWVAAHYYVIDIFLWFMARRGWTLQRTRKKGEYADLEADVQASKERQRGPLSF